MVEEDHKEDNCTKPDHEGKLRFVFRVLSERWSDRACLDDFNLHRQSAAAQYHREILRFLESFLSCDLGTSAENRLTYIRRSKDLAVKQDRNRPSDIARCEIGEFLCALIRELQVDHVLPCLWICGCLCILQICPGQNRISLLVAKLKHRRLADGLNRRVRILNARQLDDDPAVTLTLNDGFSKTQRIDALLHDGNHTVHSIIIDLGLFCINRLQDNVRPALQVKPLANGAGKWLNQEKKRANDDSNRNHQL